MANQLRIIAQSKKGMSDIVRVAIFLFLAALAGPIEAREPTQDDMTALTARFNKERRRIIAENLQLSDTEAKSFWPIYDQLEHEIAAARNHRTRIISEFGENYDQMTDAEAKKLLLEYINLEEQRGRLWKIYFEKFEKVLPIKKLARYYQIENNIHAFVEAGIAEEIPLIK
ncbi:hypothetical protein [Methylomonas sp. MgM2]